LNTVLFDNQFSGGGSMTLDQQETDNGVNAAVVTGAVMLGTADGGMKVLADRAAAASKLIEPGDQQHLQHPVDDFKHMVSKTWQVISTPDYMNIRLSAHPVEVAVNVHGALVTATADTFTKQGLVEGIRTSSAIVAGVIVETADPFKKLRALEAVADTVTDVPKAMNILQAGAGVIKPDPISWNTYEHLLGHGSQPPKLKPLRDFSDLMDYTPPKPYGLTSPLSYIPAPDHKIIMYLEHQWSDGPNPEIMHTTMDFLVRVDERLRKEHGNGPEMFHSALKLLGEYGARIDRIDGKWSEKGTLATNYDEFAKAREQGATVKQAVSHTPTGRWTADAGYTEVGGKHFNLDVRSEKLPEDLHPEFTRPVFSDDPAYNTYGKNWASSQGSESQDLVPRHAVVDASKALPKPDLPLSGLTQEQADAFRRYIHDHIDKHFDALASGRNIDAEMK
jgi:hypothetical protein